MSIKNTEILNFIKSQTNYCPDVPEQSVIDSWPQLQRKPALNADEQKFYQQYLQAVEIAP